MSPLCVPLGAGGLRRKGEWKGEETDDYLDRERQGVYPRAGHAGFLRIEVGVRGGKALCESS